MSLPSFITFVGDCKIVGKSFCNAGWFVTPESVYSCVKDAENDVSAVWYSLTKNTENVQEYERRYIDAHKQYFTTLEDLLNYEFIIVYEFIVPRDVVKGVISGSITPEQWKTDIFGRLRELDDESRDILREYHQNRNREDNIDK